jgi:prevent-host-death family protein
MKSHPVSAEAFEAKPKLGKLLAPVDKGATITITKHDRPVARLVGFEAGRTAQRAATTAELRALRARYTLGGLDAPALRAKGRA